MIRQLSGRQVVRFHDKRIIMRAVEDGMEVGVTEEGGNDDIHDTLHGIL